MVSFSEKLNINTITNNVVRDFHTKIVGVTYGNDDGSSRQEYIKRLKPGEELILRPVPTSEYPDAIGVFTLKGNQLGHISEELASELKHRYPLNYMKVTVAGVTGGGGKTYGCNIHIIIYGALSSASGNNNTSYYSPAQPATNKRKTWLWVLGWIFIFPLPLTLILLKKSDIKNSIKYCIIAVAWVLYLLMVIASGSINNDTSLISEQNSYTVENGAEVVTEQLTELPSA